MARSLTISRAVVAAGERDGFLERFRARESYFQAMGCRYWIFEEQGSPGVFVEFCEAADEETLSAAHSGSPDRFSDVGPIFSIVELN